MNDTRWLPVLCTLALAGIGCNPDPSGTDVCDGLPLEECFNLDTQIDGLDLLDTPDEIDSEDVHQCSTARGIYVVWRDERANFSDVWLNRSLDNGATWLPAPIRVKQGEGDASDIDFDCVGTQEGDRLYVAWADTRDSEYEAQNIYVNVSPDGGDTWIHEEDIALDNDPDGETASLSPKIVVDRARGRVHVVWADQVEGPPDIYVASSATGGREWSEEPIRVSGERDEDGAGQAWYGGAEVDTDDEGRLHVIYRTGKDGKQDIWYAKSNLDVSAFLPQKRLDTGDAPGSDDSFAAKIDVDGEHIYVVWHDDRAGDERDIFYNYSGDRGDNWLEFANRVESDTLGIAASLNPDLLVRGDTAHIVWQDDRNGGYDIFYRVAVAGQFDSSDEGVEIRLDTDAPGFGNSVRPKITACGDTLLVAWEDLRDDPGVGYNDLYYNYIDASEEEPEWGEADFRLDSMLPGESFTDDLNVGCRDGRVFASWVDGRNGTQDVYASAVEIGLGVDNLVDYNAALADATASE